MWSLGVLVYIMLTGYPPFYSETPTKVISRGMKKKILAGNYEFVDEDWAHISQSAKDLVARWVVSHSWKFYFNSSLSDIISVITH